MISPIIDNIDRACGCDFGDDRIERPVFHCFPDSPDSVIYHAQLHGTLNANVFELFSILQEWASSEATISVNFLLLSVESFCEVGRDPVEFCPEISTTVVEQSTTTATTAATTTPTTAKTTTTTTTTTATIAIAVAVAVALLSVLLVAGVVVVFVAVWHKQRAKLDNEASPRYVSSVNPSDVCPVAPVTPTYV